MNKRHLSLALLFVLALVIAVYAYQRFGDNRGAREAAHTAPYSGAALPLLWAQGTNESRGETQADGVGFDRQGNVFASGIFNKSVTLVGHELTSRGAGDIFALKFTPDGALAWLKQFGGAGDDNTYDVQADSSGNVILNGWFAKTVDFGGTTLVSEGSQDQFLAKLSPEGDVLWAKRFGGTGGDGGNEVVVDNAGAIYATAISEGTFTAGQYTYPNQGNQDSYIEKVSPDGSIAYVHATSGAGRERIRAINVDTAGRVFGGYEFWSELKVGDATFTSAGSKDGAIVAWDKAGNQLWAMHVSSTGDDNVRGVAAGPDGTVYVTGSFGNNAEIFGRKVTSAGAADTYLALLGATDGSLKWLMTIGTSGAEEGGVGVRAGLWWRRRGGGARLLFYSALRPPP